ncbi:MAG: T9SS type A sorting domain-containing protein [Candidatus Neomarinimicrobiota bacterium]
MKRVVALLLIASVVLFAAVAPKSSLKKAGAPMPKMPTAEIKAAPLHMDNASVKTRTINMSKAPALAVDTTVVTLVYLEDFENGANGWTQFDGTAPDPRAVWGLGDYNATGDSLWWCVDEDLGGYHTDWIVALETPSVTLSPGDSTLSFQLNLAVEEPAVYEDYDGWDGANLQISKDDGVTWAVLTDITGVPYNATSVYAFDYMLGTGPGVPGWCGTLAGDVEVNLGDYIGETVKIRFVFASDPMTCTVEEPHLFGMQVDSINVAGDAVYNGSAKDGLVSLWAGNQASGSYWAIEDRTDSIPSPTHLLRNWVSGDTTFARNLEDYYVSPSITLPDEAATLIYCDFEFWADFADETGDFPDVDYWRLEVSPDDGETWNAISNPTGDPTLPNYVYNQQIPAWYSFQYAYGEACDLTSFAGQTVKFRFYFHSDDDKPSGQGLMIDDFVVYTQPDLPTPQNITATLNDGNVDVAWQDMNGTYQMPKSFMATTPESETIGAYYAPGRTYFGDDSTTGFGLYQPYTTNGKDITFTSLDFALYNINPYGDSISVSLFGVDTMITPLYWSDNMVPDTVDGFQTLDISAANITWNGEFWVGVTWETSASFPTCYLDDGSGLKIYHPSGAFYNDGASATPFGAMGYGEVTYSGLAYNVYRRVASESVPVLIAEGLTTNSFKDEDADPFTEYVYTVACATPTFTGNVSDGASVFVISADVEEAKYDNGIASTIFELGMDTTVAVKITPSKYPAKLEALRFNSYFAMDVYKIALYKDDNGTPGQAWLKIEPKVTAIEDWNTFKIVDALTVNDGNGIVLRDGESVWIGVKGATAGDYPAWLSADNQSAFSGMSAMQVPGGNWASTAPYLMANPLIRGYFDTDIDTTAIADVPVPSKYALAQNYPNPFNPVTTIHFELKNSGMTKLDIFDVTGRHVRTLLNGTVDAGAYDLRFDASALSSGIYFYRLTSGSFTDIKKMSLLK